MRSRNGTAREVRARDGECGRAGPGRCGGAGAEGAQAGSWGVCPPAAPRARPLIGREPRGQRVGVGCWVRARGGRARAEMDGARSAP